MRSDKKWRWFAFVLGFLTLFTIRGVALATGIAPWTAEAMAILGATTLILLITFVRSQTSRSKLEAANQPIEFLFRPFSALSEAVMLFFAMVGGIFLIHQLLGGSEFHDIPFVGLAAVLALAISLETTAYETISD